MEKIYLPMIAFDKKPILDDNHQITNIEDLNAVPINLFDYNRFEFSTYHSDDSDIGELWKDEKFSGLYIYASQNKLGDLIDDLTKGACHVDDSFIIIFDEDDE